MLKLSKKVDYALIALMHLAQQDEGASSAREVATIYGMPQDLLAKVLQKLTRSGLVVSHQGMKGGYSLARPAEPRYRDSRPAIHVRPPEAISGPG